MLQPNLRRDLAAIVLVSVVSLLLAQPAGAVPRLRQRSTVESSRLVERWRSLAWSFVGGLWEKAGMRIDPNGNRNEPAETDDHP